MNGLYEDVLEKIKERKVIYLSSLSSGTFRTFEDYKFCAGRLNGLKEAETIVREVYRNMFEGGN